MSQPNKNTEKQGQEIASNSAAQPTTCPACNGSLGSVEHPEGLAHVDTCEFYRYNCPCPGATCNWQGSLEQVMPHFVTSHKRITTLQGDDIVFLATDINLPGSVDWVMMQSCFGHHFMLILDKRETDKGHKFSALVQLIGSKEQAKNFACRLELDGHRRRLTWEAMPRSICEGVSSAIMNSDCLVFDTAVAQYYTIDEGTLSINVTITMVQEHQKSIL